MNASDMNWVGIPNSTLNIHATLSSGQCFRWRVMEDGEWRGVIANQFVRLRPSENGFYWQTYPQLDHWAEIERYFRLDVDLGSLLNDWQARDIESSHCFRNNSGMRILDQLPREAFFSFLCASNNSILKIRKSVSLLAQRAGQPLFNLDGQTYYAFPTVSAILNVSESELRSDMWGFRAPRVAAMAEFLAAKEDSWLGDLRALPYSNAHNELTQLYGIGSKLADCIALFGLGFDEAVPVDTHIRQIALRKFGPQTGTKSLTQNEYSAVAGRFRELYGPYAGWAQQYLFFDELTLGTTQNRMAKLPE